MFGSTEAGWTGVTVLSHPRNFRHPEPMRLWPERFKHIFLNFAPSQLGDWAMEPGRDYVFRYRFYVHQDKADVDEMERVWNDFADPPKAEIKWLAAPGRVTAN